jgi:hypothetical protein
LAVLAKRRRDATDLRGEECRWSERVDDAPSDHVPHHTPGKEIADFELGLK